MSSNTSSKVWVILQIYSHLEASKMWLSQRCIRVTSRGTCLHIYIVFEHLLYVDHEINIPSNRGDRWFLCRFDRRITEYQGQMLPNMSLPPAVVNDMSLLSSVLTTLVTNNINRVKSDIDSEIKASKKVKLTITLRWISSWSGRCFLFVLAIISSVVHASSILFLVSCHLGDSLIVLQNNI